MDKASDLRERLEAAMTPEQLRAAEAAEALPDDAEPGKEAPDVPAPH